MPGEGAVVPSATLFWKAAPESSGSCQSNLGSCLKSW